MARTKKSQQSYTAGEKGRNRVRVFPDPKTGMFQIEYRRNGRRESRSLKHRDWALAKDQADKLAANFPPPEAKPERRPQEPLRRRRTANGPCPPRITPRPAIANWLGRST